MENSQSQKSGNNSTQFQAGMIVINQGIEEKRAREIFMEMFDKARESFSIEAIETAQRRVIKFEEDLIPKMQKIEGALEAFSDPLFQVMLTSAHKTAAITENENDYSILSELLIHKIKKGNDRKSIAGISKAIEIVNEVPEESLLALTIVYAWQMIQPLSGEIGQGLDSLNDLFECLIYDELPKGTEWLEQLDVLSAIRIREFSKFKKLEEFYKEKLNGYCCLGIKKDTENYNKACELLRSIKMEDILIDNELNNDYVRLAIVNKEQINDIRMVKLDLKTGEEIGMLISEDEINILNKVFSMYEQSLNEEVMVKFVNEIEKRPNLQKLKEWINNIEKSFSITPVGKVLAHANAQRCNNEFPPLN